QLLSDIPVKVETAPAAKVIAMKNSNVFELKPDLGYDRFNTNIIKPINSPPTPTTVNATAGMPSSASICSRVFGSVGLDGVNNPATNAVNLAIRPITQATFAEPLCA